MKLSPMMQFNIAFWSITVPLLILMVIVLIPVFCFSIVPKWRQPLLNWYDRLANSLVKWRHNSYVKRYYYKAHLFDIIKK